MDLKYYYKLYTILKTGTLIPHICNIANKINIRYLLVRIDTNFLCNLRCKTCYFSGPDIEKFMIQPMSIELYSKIAKDIFPKTRILYLSCGGEPLITKNFENYIEIARHHKVPFIGYITNGLLLNEKIIKSSIKNKVKEVTISIDGATKKTYENIRVKGNYDLLMNNLGIFKTIKNQMSSTFPKLRFNYTITRSNYNEIPLMIELAKKYNIESVKFRIYEDWGGSLNYEEESLIGYEEDFNKHLKDGLLLAKKHKIKYYAPLPFNLLKISDNHNNITVKNGIISDNVTRSNSVNIKNPPCIYPWFFRYIDPKGRVRVCANLPLSEYSLEKCNSIYFDYSTEEVNRKNLLTAGDKNSCFYNVCHGSYLIRKNDDANNIYKSNI